MISLRSVSGEQLPFKLIRFPAGEPHVDIGGLRDNAAVVIDWRFAEAGELFDVLALNDALVRAGLLVRLFVPYMPAARQDRAQPGFAFTLSIVARVLGACGFTSVEVVDPHSAVTPGHVAGCKVRELASVVPPGVISADTVLVCPDEGASARVVSVALRFGIQRIISCRKRRDAATGALSGFELVGTSNVCATDRLLVVDDICDGGGTFLGIADVLDRAAGGRLAALDLWVTHGVFSKGLAPLLNRYRTIHTTDSLPQRHESPRLHVHPLLPY